MSWVLGSVTLVVWPEKIRSPVGSNDGTRRFLQPAENTARSTSSSWILRTIIVI
jgi:hypothetical protein